MLIKVQGVWEAKRIADVLAANAERSVYGSAWNYDLSNRIMNQVEQEERKRHGSTNR